MTAEKEYLVYLLSCFLGGNKPEGRKTEWNEIYRLAEINDIEAIVASEIKKLDSAYAPEGELRSRFNQQLGQSIIHSERRDEAYKRLNAFLDGVAFERIFVKGIVLCNFYPAKELRTSGDIDVILRENDFNRLEELNENGTLSEYGLTDFKYTPVTCSVSADGLMIELHRNADVFGSYFDTIFDIAEKKSGYIRELDGYNHLLYVMCHLAKHLKERGAGIRMLLDIDVLIRHIENFDESCFYSLCSEAKIESTARMILSYCNYCFNTPVSDSSDIKENKDMRDLFASVFIDGGSFGFAASNNATLHLNNSSVSGEINKRARLKILLRYVFPPACYVREYYAYSVKHKALVPLAYINRIFDAVFKRSERSVKTLKEINRLDGKDTKIKSLIDELEL
ncbi:MAG: nucleotidyltransferase family protein [Eubacterium sp.]|nr:nucleotidyltransferase family protein [Eubacterium sp.]